MLIGWLENDTKIAQVILILPTVLHSNCKITVILDEVKILDRCYVWNFPVNQYFQLFLLAGWFIWKNWASVACLGLHSLTMSFFYDSEIEPRIILLVYLEIHYCSFDLNLIFDVFTKLNFTQIEEFVKSECRRSNKHTNIVLLFFILLTTLTIPEYRSNRIGEPVVRSPLVFSKVENGDKLIVCQDELTASIDKTRIKPQITRNFAMESNAKGFGI